ncbi:hypothetical protein ACTFIR_012881 [Dictyostelium discoideum]
MLRRNELLDQETRNYFNMKVTSSEKNSSISRIKNRCVETGRSRGIISAYRISRLRFREYMKMGLIRLLSKATSVTVIGSKRVLEILSRFEHEGLIRGFQIIDIRKNKVSIYLKYKQDMTSLLSKLKVVSVNKEKLYIKGNLLKKLNTGVNMYFVESKFGLQTLPQLKIRNKSQNKSLNTFEIEYKIAHKAVKIKSSGKMGVITKELKLKEPAIQSNNIYYLKNHGDSRIIIGTMKQQIQGVLAGFCIELKLVGLGFVVHKVGNTLVLDVGYSHYRSCLIPKEVVVKLEGSHIILYSINKEKVTTFASLLKTFKKINMYKGTGILGELKKKIKGVNFNIAQKVIMLSGNVGSIKGNTLIQSEEKQIVDILQRFKGLYSHNYGLKEEALAKIRRIENVYKYIRVRQGYPVRGRTKSNANTVKRQKNVSTAHIVRIEMFEEKIDRLDLIFTKYVEYKFPLYLLGKLWLYKFIRRKFNLIGPLNEQFLSPYLQFNLYFDKSKARKETFKVYLGKIGFALLHVFYLSCIAYYDSFLYAKVMNDWLEEVMRTRY